MTNKGRKAPCFYNKEEFMPYFLVVFVLFTSHTHAMDLSALITQTINSHPTVQVEQNRLAIAETERSLAQQQYYPTFSISYENAVQTRDFDINYQGDQQVTTFRLQQPLYTFGRLDAGLAKTQAQVDSQTMTIHEVQLQLAQAVLQAWGEWFAATLRSEAIDKSIATHERLKQSVTRRTDRGASSPSEVQLSVARLAQINAQAANTQLQIAAAKVKLEQYIGTRIPAQTTPKQFLKFAVQNTALMIQEALDNNPTLERFAADIRRSQAQAREDSASLKPEVYLRAEHQRGDFSTATPFQNRIFVGLQSNFGAGLSALDKLTLAQQRTEALKAEVNVVERQVIERVQLETTQLEILALRQTALELSLEANEGIAEAFNRQYLAGRRSWVEVMNTARELAQAELELADLKAAKVLSYWRLAFLVKGLDGTLSLSQPVEMK